jgi:ABC-type sugar transport system ATPase subunit
MLELRNIHKSLGDVRVLNGVNLRLEHSFVYTLKSGKGSGKMILQIKHNPDYIIETSDCILQMRRGIL